MFDVLPKCVGVGALPRSSSLFFFLGSELNAIENAPNCCVEGQVEKGGVQSYSGTYENCSSASNPNFENGRQETLRLKA